MPQYDAPGAEVEPPGTPEPSRAPEHPPRRRAALLLLVGLAAVAGVAIALVLSRLVLAGPGAASPTPTGPPTATASGSSTASGSATPSPDDTAARTAALASLLAQRGTSVTSRDRDLFLATVDPAATDFYATQGELFDRVAGLELAAWSYAVTGDGPGFTPQRAAELPTGSVIVRVRLTYRLAGTDTTTDREQYLTVVPRGGGWLVAADTDASAAGLDTQRDLWDLGPVRVVRGASSLVLADVRGATKAQVRRIADEADLAVHDVDDVWTGEWSREPLVVLPRSQQDMATLINSAGDGLAQIAAVTTGSFESGLSRGDRIVINPAAWDTLGALGRRVVLTHEMTHVATRSSSVTAPPIWLSEGFADYVAYQASPVPVTIVASDVLDDVHDGNIPQQLPTDDDFDASRGNISAAYEGAWLACRLIAQRYGEEKLVALYAAVTDSSGAGYPDEMREVLGIGERTLVRDWKAYLRDKAAA
ncbi:MAG: hypothetical protein ABI807_00410 [Sporichthyaceae bacterium]